MRLPVPPCPSCHSSIPIRFCGQIHLLGLTFSTTMHYLLAAHYDPCCGHCHALAGAIKCVSQCTCPPSMSCILCKLKLIQCSDLGMVSSLIPPRYTWIVASGPSVVAHLLVSDHGFSIEPLRHSPHPTPREESLCCSCTRVRVVEDEVLRCPLSSVPSFPPTTLDSLSGQSLSSRKYLTVSHHLYFIPINFSLCRPIIHTTYVYTEWNEGKVAACLTVLCVTVVTPVVATSVRDRLLAWYTISKSRVEARNRIHPPPPPPPHVSARF